MTLFHQQRRKELGRSSRKEENRRSTHTHSGFNLVKSSGFLGCRMQFEKSHRQTRFTVNRQVSSRLFTRSSILHLPYAIFLSPSLTAKTELTQQPIVNRNRYNKIVWHDLNNPNWRNRQFESVRLSLNPFDLQNYYANDLVDVHAKPPKD